MGAQPPGEAEVDAVSGGQILDGGLDEVLQTVGGGDEDADEHGQALEDRCQRVDPVPHLGCGRTVQGAGDGRVADS